MCTEITELLYDVTPLWLNYNLIERRYERILIWLNSDLDELMTEL